MDRTTHTHAHRYIFQGHLPLHRLYGHNTVHIWTQHRLYYMDTTQITCRNKQEEKKTNNWPRKGE